MHQVQLHGIKYHIAEPGVMNQNPAEHVIGEIRRKWYRTMIRKQVPKVLWDYGMIWVSEIMSRTYSAAGNLNGSIPIQGVMGETEDISEYLDFGFYDRIWYKDNAGLGPAQAGRWLGVSSRTGRLMTYHVLTSIGRVVSRSTVQRVPHLELQTDAVKKVFDDLDVNISNKLNHHMHYEADNPTLLTGLIL